MPIAECLPRTEGVAQWPVWSTTARLIVTDPAVLGEARDIVQAQCSLVEAACSRFRSDSEIHRVAAACGQPLEVSPVLAELLATALEAARRTDGDVDPTLGHALADIGYDRDISLVPSTGPALRVATYRAAGWQQVRLEGRYLQVPEGVGLDLGATAKALTADRAAANISRRLGVGVLVSLGGDIATAGAAPDGGWQVLVQDRPGDPACTISLPGGTALATSSTQSRTWRRGPALVHHIIDPRTCLPAPPVWRTVTVAQSSCVRANTLTTSTIVRGHRGLPMLRAAGVPARLVTAAGDVVTTAAWQAAEDPS